MNKLSEREKKFLQMIFDHTAGDEPLVSGELYQLAGRNGFSDDEVFSISDLLSKSGLLEMEKLTGEQTASGASVVFWVKLTSRGVSCLRCFE